MKRFALVLTTATLAAAPLMADQSTRYNDLRLDTTQPAQVEPNAATRDGTVVRGETIPGNVVDGEQPVTFSSRNAPRNSGYMDTFRAGGVGPFNDSR
ncbi:MAG: hypothetical protein AAGM84_14510 [Pseudomonadota bacterium]